jgi:hypothetical protein
LAGKNAGGALVVHTADYSYYFPPDFCGADYVDPGTCENAGTESTVDGNFDAAIVWLLAAFPSGSDPGVTVIYFGLEHNLPFGFFAASSFCGPEGTLEIPDTGWPNDWETAGNSVAFGAPIAGQQLFMFYYLAAWGVEGNYLGTGINPTGGYAGFVSDDNPGVLDEIHLFGRMEWFAPGWNQCPNGAPIEACCFDDGTCQELLPAECEAQGGTPWGFGTVCDPNPCPPPERVCCIEGECFIMTEEDCLTDDGLWFPDEETCEGFECPPVATEETTWGSIKSDYR